MKFAALILAIGAVSAAHAQVVIDDFTSGAGDYTVDSASAYYTDMSGSMVGGSRTLVAAYSDNPYGNFQEFSAGGGYGSFSQGSGVDGTMGLGYGYTSSADHTSYSTFDLGLNLSGESQFKLDFAYNETAMTGYLIVNASQQVDFSVAAGAGAQSVVLDFSNWSGIDWSDVHQLGIVFNDPTSNDFVMSDFQATPEPASFAVLGLGAVALIARRRRA